MHNRACVSFTGPNSSISKKKLVHTIEDEAVLKREDGEKTSPQWINSKGVKEIEEESTRRNQSLYPL